MDVALVRATIYNAPVDCECGTKTSFFCSLPVTAAKLAQELPFEGRFAFRYKVSGPKVERLGIRGVESVWMDAMDPHKELPCQNTDVVPTLEVRAIVLELPSDSEMVDDFLVESLDLYLKNGDEAKYIEYLQKVSEVIPMDHRDRPDRTPIDVKAFEARMRAQENAAGGKKGFSFNKFGEGMGKLVKKGANNIKQADIASVGASIWGGVTSAAAGVTTFLAGGSTSVLSDLSMENLSQLTDAMDTKFDDSSDKDAALLQELWQACFGAEVPYARTSLKWKEMGFQTEDPIADLKSSGTLALRGMLHLASNYRTRTQQMLVNNKQNLKTKYPFAIVGVNVTLLLADVLKVSQMGFLGIQATYWELFESDDAFYELFSYCFMAMDLMWTQRNAQRKDFGKLTGEIKEKVKSILKGGPQSTRDFKLMALDNGFACNA